MSLEAWVAVLHAQITNSSAKAVLAGLANHAGPDGRHAYPSITRLSVYTGLTNRTITRVLAELVVDGFVSVVSQGGGRGHPTEYEIDLKALAQLRDPRLDALDLAVRHRRERVTDSQGSFPERVTASARKGDSHARKGDTESPEPYLTTLNHEEQVHTRAGLSKAEQDAARKTMEEHFKVLTSLTVPPSKKEAGELWWAPLREVCSLVEWVPGVGIELLTVCVQRAKQNRTEVASPKSIIKYARAIRAAQLRGEPGGVLGGNGRAGNARQGYDPAADMADFKAKRGLK